MKPSIQFFVAGIPRPAGSKRYFPIRKGGVPTGKAIIVDACAKSKDWKVDVRAEADRAIRNFEVNPSALKIDWTPIYHAPLRVSFRFQLTHPKGHYGTGKNAASVKDSAPRFHVTTPDVLKLARAIEDALKGIIYRDDSQIVTELITKRYADRPGVYIEIAEECE